MTRKLALIGTVLAFAIFITPSADAKGYWVFGDSLTSEHNSWASQLNNRGLAHIQNVAQAGSLMVGTSMPTQMSCRNREVILWLGTNDAGTGIPLTQYEISLRDKLAFLKNRDCRVWLVMPLKLELSRGHSVRTWKVRKLTRRVSREYSNTTLLDAPYNPIDTTDGLHPTTEQAGEIADWFAKRLNLN